ncbi:hypothetical protein CVT25_011839 [Psilocybe cyanescens]|uniref:Transcription factor CBF/NF-Y/archaeal histone domain-containing protein n=1 Tax=Psilocybe cyanescens TaxID=93625 RepID=A0A409WIZ8_PSICY|nr:hypothetical protein CVT25_011839 [Psilocybe cyanescens]
MSTQPFVQPGEPLNDFLRSFWQRQITTAEEETPDYRHPPLPLARIKKVMKSDPDVKMIAADAPILFCKACETEITARAFIVADSNKRRTLSRADIAKALSKSDQFDFLIDIVPREEAAFPVPLNGSGPGASSSSAAAAAAAKKAGQSKQDQGQNGEDVQADLDSMDGPGTSKEVLDQLESLLGNNSAGQRGPLS